MISTTPAEHIVEYIRPHWLKKVQAAIWYFLILIVPLWLVRVLSESPFIKQFSVTTLSNIIIGFIALWFIGLLVMLFRKHAVHAFLTDSRLVMLRGATAWAVPYDKIEKAVIWYPTHLARLIQLGTLTLTTDGNEAKIQSIYRPEAILATITELSGIQSEVMTEPVQIAEANMLSHKQLQLNTVAEQPIMLPAKLEMPALKNEPPRLESEAWVLPEVEQVTQFERPSTINDQLLELHEGEAVYF